MQFPSEPRFEEPAIRPGEDAPSAPFRVRTFGGLSIEGRDADVSGVVTQRKRLAFLALLAASEPRGISRDRLLLLLWPESTIERARGGLYQLLYVVRQAFGEESLLGTDELRLDPSIVSSDVADFTAALARGDLATAVDLYAGPFLDAFHLSGAVELERWIEDKRQELARGYQSALSRLATQAMERGELASAVGFAERLVAADPLSERATVLLMEALAASGDVASALERARIHALIVREELGADVDASVSALAARLRSRGGAASSAVVPPSLPSLDAPPAVSSGAPERGPAKRVANAIWQKRVAWIAAAAVSVIGVTLVAFLPRPRDRGVEWVVVADFQTAAADSQVADVLTDLTRRGLSDAHALRSVPNNRLVSARSRLHMAPNARLDVALARQIAIGEAMRAFVAPSLKSFGNSYVLSLQLRSTANGDVLASAQQSGIAEGQLFAALDAVIRQLRERAGEDLKIIRDQPPLITLTSASLPAMVDYVAALRLPRTEAARAVALLREATTLDSSFASAIWQLAHHMEGVSSTDEERRALLARAWAHRDGLTDYERLRLEIAYFYSPNGKTPDVDEHLKRLRRLAEDYPNADDYHILGNFYIRQRNLAAAESSLRTAIKLDSSSRETRADLVNAYVKDGRVAEAKRVLDALPDADPGRDQWDAILAYTEGHPEKARAAFERLKTTAGPFRLMAYGQSAEFDLLEGRIGAWEKGLRTADSVAAATSPSGRPRPPRSLLAIAPELLTAYWVRNQPREALQILELELANNPALRHDPGAAAFFAQFGEADSARALLASRPMDRSAYDHGMDTLPASAWIDLAQGRAHDASVKFRRSILGGWVPSQRGLDPQIGLAFERAGMPDSAIVAYEHYLHGANTWEADAFYLVPVLERVAPLYEKRGDRTKAREAYARIADLWKNADPELQSRVGEAREHLAALR